jgi:hypothetical protein
MDFVNYRNFNIQLYTIANTNTYRVSFDPTILSNLGSQQGLITVDVSTGATAYTQNGGLLALDVSSWGIINNSYERQFPMIGKSDYTIEYQYNILNNAVYANLLNIYPRIQTSALNVSSIGNNTGIDPTNLGIFSSGTQLYARWSNYLFSTFGLPNYYAKVNIDVNIDTSGPQTVGSYVWPVSTATFTMPATSYTSGSYPTIIQTYVVGQPNTAAQFSAVTYVP